MSSYQNIFIVLLAVSLLALIIVNVSSCGCNDIKNSENYVSEYTGNGKTCTNSYRLYTDVSDGSDRYSRNRCQFCKEYNNYSVESFVDIDTTNTFKLCPHNCRQYGVASCDQGSIL